MPDCLTSQPRAQWPALTARKTPSAIGGNAVLAVLHQPVRITPMHETHACAALQIPPVGRGSMYLRPLLLGTGPTLGLAPSPEITFVVFSAAVGSYFAGGQLTPINLKIETRYHRAAPYGVGAAKCAGAAPPSRLHRMHQPHVQNTYTHEPHVQRFRGQIPPLGSALTTRKRN